MTIKEIQAGYLVSSYFKDVYLYLAQNKLPSNKTATNPDKETTVLAILEACADKIITLYHSSLFAGHQGATKTYLTINNKFFIPNLIYYLHSYIKGCHIFHLSCNEKPLTKQLQTRINLNYRHYQD